MSVSRSRETNFALSIIGEERDRQVNRLGWTPEHDDEHTNGELVRAAACYALPPASYVRSGHIGKPSLWPWDMAWWKPTPEDRITELVKAGALIVAELERLDRGGAYD